MATAQLTTRSVKALVATAGLAELWDTDVQGLHVVVTPGGARTFYVRYRSPRGRRRFKLGTFGALTVDQARKLARQALADVARGLDPAGIRQAERTAETFSQVAKTWLEQHADATCKPRTARRYRELVNLHLLPLLGSLKIAEVTRADVERAHRKIGEKTGRGGKAHGTANRALLVASALFNWCEAHNLRPQGSNPARGVKKFKQEAKGYFLSAAELARLVGVLDAGERAKQGEPVYFAPGTIAAVRLLMLTGARLSEVTGLRWSEVDLDRAQLVLGDSKTGRSVRPIIPAAVQLLRALKKSRDRVGEFVCASASGKPIGATNVDRAWRSIRERAKLPKVARLHDLRHTAGSLALEAGVPLPAVSRMLGHKSVATTARIYAHVLDASQHVVKFGDALATKLAQGAAENRAEAAKVVGIAGAKRRRAKS